MKRSAWLTVALALALLPTGCVTRRYLITSNPPGAVVFRDGQPIGATPVEQQFVYYGRYNFRLVKDGYEPLDVQPQLVTPWYEIPGIDFFTENLVPYTFRDVQVLNFELKPLTPVRQDDLQRRAGELKDRGAAVQPHTGPRSTPAAPPPQTVLPAPTAEPPTAAPLPPRLGAPTPAPPTSP